MRGTFGWRLVASIWVALFVSAGLIAAAPARADDKPQPEHDYDSYNAQSINNTCASCHGEYGQGGGGGTYPRLGGLPFAYLARQLELFKTRERENIPMIPYATERELNEQDVLDISWYLSQMELRRHFPPADQEMDGLERLRLSRQVVQIPRYPGDVEKGDQLYNADCRQCHGPEGWGRSKRPQLAGQFSGYLLNQMKSFVARTRFHDEDIEDLLDHYGEDDFAAILAYLSVVDD